MRSVFFLMTVLFLSSNALIAQNWEKYKAEDLQFIAYYPSEPKRTVKKVNTDLGKIDMHMIYSSESSDDNIYSVYRTDYPEEQFKDADEVYYATFLDGAVNGAVSNVKGILVYDNIVKFNGYPGRSIKISVQGAFIIYMNAYLVENYLFIAQVVCTEAKDENASIERFLNSFELIKTK